MDKRKYFEKIRSVFEKFIQPFGVLVILALFVLPVLSVINLSPKTGKLYNNVLGTNDSKIFEIQKINNDSKEYFSDNGENEKPILTNTTLEKVSSTYYKYYGDLQNRIAGTYRYEEILLDNNSDVEKTIKVEGKTESGSTTRVSIKSRNMLLMLQSESGEHFDHYIKVNPGEEIKVQIVIYNRAPIFFNEELKLYITENN